MNRMANLPNGDAIIIAKKGGTYYMNINGHDLDLTQVIAGKQSVFDAPGTSKATKAEIRAAFHRSYASATFWQKVQKHFTVIPYLKDIGVGHCVTACDFHEKYLDPIETKRIAAKLFIVQKVLTPFSLSYGVLIQCMIAPDQCDTKLQVGTNREESDLNRKLEAELTEYIAEHGVEKLSKLAEKAADINKLGLSGYMTKLIAEKVAETLGGDSAKLATGTALDKVVPIAGQVELALSIITAEDAIPQIDKTVAYTARSMAALQLAEMFTTVVSEMHSGHMDLTELGSFADQFSNIPKDANGNGCDATSSPFYNAVSGSVSGSSSAFGSLFGSSAFAEGTFSNNVTAGVCKCANGQPVPKGKLVCAEENFADPGIFLQAINMFLDNAESISAVGFHVPSYLPGADAYNTAVSPALAAVLGVEKLAKIIIGAGSELAVAGCGKIPACNSALQYFGSTFAEFAGWVVKAIVPNPFAALTGGMNVDMVGAGFDVKYNRYSQDVLGRPRSMKRPP